VSLEVVPGATHIQSIDLQIDHSFQCAWLLDQLSLWILSMATEVSSYTGSRSVDRLSPTDRLSAPDATGGEVGIGMVERSAALLGL